MEQMPVVVSQHAPPVGLQTKTDVPHCWPGTLVPPERAQTVGSRLWQELQQQHAGACLEHCGNAAEHAVFAVKTWPSCWQVAEEVIVQIMLVVLQHAPCTDWAQTAGLHG